MEFKGYPDNWLEELKSKNDIVDVISRYMRLDKKGGRFWGCCPFHHEKTPSFAVSPERGSYHCFGCHTGGDVISFVMHIENVGYVDAVAILASRAGMRVPELSGTNKLDKEKRDKLYALMKAAALFYYNCLKKSPETLTYLKNRGISPQTITKFGLGKSPDFERLIPALEQEGFDRKDMLDVGLIAEKNGRFYDSLGGRLIIPIIDGFGNVIAFGGRILEKSDFAKYKNSKETRIFVKNRTLFSLNNVKELKRSEKVDDIIIVEGYMDVIALYQAGIKNVVASMGTALTVQQAKLLKTYVNNVFICYDGDAAGQKSTLLGLNILKANDLNVKVISLPDGLDPDEIVRQRGTSAFMKCKNEALPLYEYRLMRATEGFDFSTPDGRSGYAKKALEIISELDTLEHAAYIDYISKKTGLSKEILENNLVSVEETRQALPEKSSAPRNGAYIEAIRFVLYSMISGCSYANDRLDPQVFADKLYKDLYAYVDESRILGRKTDFSELIQTEEDNEELNAIIKYPIERVKDAEKYYANCITKIKREGYKESIRLLEAEYSATADEEQKEQILKMIISLQKK